MNWANIIWLWLDVIWDSFSKRDTHIPNRIQLADPTRKIPNIYRKQRTHCGNSIKRCVFSVNPHGAVQVQIAIIMPNRLLIADCE